MATPPLPTSYMRKPMFRYSRNSSDQIVTMFVKLVEGKIDVDSLNDWIRSGDIQALLQRNPELQVEEVTRAKFAKFFLLVVKFLLDKRIMEDRTKWKKPDVEKKYNNFKDENVPFAPEQGFMVTSQEYDTNFPSIGQVENQSRKKQLLNRVNQPSEFSADNKNGPRRITPGRRVTPTKISLDVDRTKTWPPDGKNDPSNRRGVSNQNSRFPSNQNSRRASNQTSNQKPAEVDGKEPIKITRKTTKVLDALFDVYGEILRCEFCPSATSELHYFMSMLFGKTTPFSNARKQISKQNIAIILGLRTFRNKEDCLTFALKIVISKLDVLKYSETSIHSLIEILPDDFPEFKHPLIEITKQNVGLNECNNLLSLVSMFQNLNFALEQQDCTNNNILVINEFESLASEWHHKLVFTADEIIRKVNSLIQVCNHEVGNLTLVAEKFVGRLIKTALTINQQPKDKMKLLNFRMSQTHEDINGEFNYDETFFKDFLTYCSTMSPTLVFFIKQTLVFSIKKLTSEDLRTVSHPFLTAGCSCCIEYIKILKCLGKFLGFIEFKPFWTMDAAPESLLDRCIMFRSEMAPPLDFVKLLKEACENGTLGVVVPLVVEFLIMGDALSLRLPYISKINKLLLSIKAAIDDDDSGARIVAIAFDDDTRFAKVSADTFNFLSLQIGKIFTMTSLHEENFYALMENEFRHGQAVAESSIVDNSIFVSSPLILETCSKFNIINTALPASYRNYARHITPTVIPADSQTSDVQSIKEKLGASFLSGYKGMNTIIDFLLTRALQVCEKEFPIIYLQILNEPLCSDGVLLQPDSITMENPTAVMIVKENALKFQTSIAEKSEEIKKRILQAFPLLLDLGLPQPVITTAEKLLTLKLDTLIKNLIDQKYPEENMVPNLIKDYQEKKPRPERDVAEIAPMLIRLQTYIYGITIKNDFNQFDEYEVINLLDEVTSEAFEAADFDSVVSTLYILSMDLLWTIVVNAPEKITNEFISGMISFWKKVRPYVTNQCEMRILCSRNIQMALASPEKGGIPKAVSLIFQHLIQNECITYDEFEYQSLSLFHISWDQYELRFINKLLDQIREGFRHMGSSEDALLLDWMVETAHDLQEDFD